MDISQGTAGYIRDAIWFGVGFGFGFFAAQKYFEKRYLELAEGEIVALKEYYRNKYDVVPTGDDELVIDDEIKPDLATYVNQTIIEHHNYSVTSDGVKSSDEQPEKDIQVISEDQFIEEHNEYDKVTLNYYDEDDQFIDDSDDIVPAPASLIGYEWSDHWGYGASDENTVYIRNNRQSTDYEVIRFFKSSVD